MPIGDLFMQQDPYKGVPRHYTEAHDSEGGGRLRAPVAGEALPSQVRFPGALLASHVMLRSAMCGTFAGLALGAFGVGMKKIEHGLVAGAGRFGFVGMVGGGLLGLAATLAKAATDDTMDAKGISERSRRLMFNTEQARLDKWALGGCLIGSMAGFQSKPPLSAAKCVPWFAAGAVLSWWATSQLEKTRLEKKRVQ